MIKLLVVTLVLYFISMPVLNGRPYSNSIFQLICLILIGVIWSYAFARRRLRNNISKGLAFIIVVMNCYWIYIIYEDLPRLYEFEKRLRPAIEKEQERMRAIATQSAVPSVLNEAPNQAADSTARQEPRRESP